MFYPIINPITTVTALQYRVKGGGPNGWTYIDPAQIEVMNRDAGPMIRVTSPDFSYYRAANTSVQVQANLTGGYLTADDLPPDLEFAARRLVWWAYKQKGAPMERTAIPETGQIVVPGYWPMDIKTLLDPFKYVLSR
jgi:hypothetical protein